ncbi:MAG: vitamin K epoxide reductase family protein [Chloroflexi bacterium]|nr:vitamin K epoxide reductase family protein [Chloroflexota bacterium]MCL5110110.1 vitamin K epoxide reductase family protein [Chloroflexota bacterium]MDA8219742.1 vitamin K epoxide reductase family protein [Dehalococcoidales bacterium]
MSVPRERKKERLQRLQAQRLQPAVRAVGNGLVPVMLALAAVGIVVSGYLAVTYFNDAQVACYGLGQCEQVQASAYARVFGVPIAYFGLLSYAAIAVLLEGRLRLSGDRAYLALLGALSLAVAGMVFSAYLTYVEFFVIDALCPWCLTSAVVAVVLAAVAAVQVRRETGVR